MDSPSAGLVRFRDCTRRELVFLALGAMDVCIITPLYAALLSPLVDLKPLPTVLALLAAIMAIHYLARLAFRLPVRSWLRSGLMATGMMVSGLVAIHGTLYAQSSLWRFGWARGILASLKQDIFSSEILVFCLVVFLWWRGIVLAQRRLDSRSVAFRFRLGVVLLAVTSGIAGAMVSWPTHHLVFVFFFTSLLAIALARAEEVGHQFGGRQSPFGLGWLFILVATSAIVLLLAVGLTSLLTGENLGRVLRPVLQVVQVVAYALVFAFAWIARLVIEPLLALLRRLEVGKALQEAFEQLEFPEPMAGEAPQPEPVLTPEQQAALRVAVAVIGLSALLLIVAVSLYRLRLKSSDLSREKRESVWEGVHLRGGLDDLLKQGQRRLGGLTDALMRSRLGDVFTALTIRRIYAHTASLAETRGYPRAIAETPYDYLPALLRAFPNSPDEVTEITECYVAVHYGELPEQRERLAAVRSAWERIRRGVSDADS